MGVARPLISAPPPATSSIARFCGAPGVGEGYWKPYGVGTVDVPTGRNISEVVVVSVATVVVTGERLLAAANSSCCF